MRRPFLFWGFKSSQQLLDGRLGSLERDVLERVWQRGESSVRDVCERLEPTVAYTTVMTTMDRLFKKGLLARRKSGRAFLYRAAATKYKRLFLLPPCGREKVALAKRGSDECVRQGRHPLLR